MVIVTSHYAEPKGVITHPRYKGRGADHYTWNHGTIKEYTTRERERIEDQKEEDDVAARMRREVHV